MGKQGAQGEGPLLRHRAEGRGGGLCLFLQPLPGCPSTTLLAIATSWLSPMR